ncbi:site-specific recombinase phage integrase family [Bacteroides sp. CAG:443]|nr:site-specific recombinase phage integrase family [Bacteroides sp. CAG:443]
MGHSSVKVTETYFKVHSDEQINEMNRGILKYTFQQ